MSAAPLLRPLEVPSDLLNVHAYYKWRLRCRNAGREIHGSDKEDWFQAQFELISIFSRLNPGQLSQVTSLVVKAIPPEGTPLDKNAIRTRAFYKSLSREKAGLPSDPGADWIAAEKEEQFATFAHLFLVKLSELRTPETLQLRTLFQEYPRLYNPNELLDG